MGVQRSLLHAAPGGGVRLLAALALPASASGGEQADAKTAVSGNSVTVENTVPEPEGEMQCPGPWVHAAATADLIDKCPLLDLDNHPENCSMARRYTPPWDIAQYWGYENTRLIVDHIVKLPPQSGCSSAQVDTPATNVLVFLRIALT